MLSTTLTPESALFPDLSRDATRSEIEPFHDQFVNAIREGVRRFNTIEPSLLYTLVRWKRTKANSVWAFIVTEIENTFRDVSGIAVVPVYGSVEIRIGNNVVARIKKMRPDGFTSNYATARVTAFHTSDQGELFGFMWAKPVKVDIGYIEDATGTQIAEILVACRSDLRTMAWTYPMTAPATVVDIPATEAPAAAENETRIVAREPETKTSENRDE